MDDLTGKQRHHLRGLGHSLKPLVHIGKDGITDGFIGAVAQALADHELIKVKMTDAVELDRHEAADEIGKRTESHVAQVLGNVILLYKAHPENPKIELP